MSINERMFEIMKKKNIKNNELADFLNINKSVISAWKSRGTNPPSEYLFQICKFLNISIYELLGVELNELTENEELILKYNQASNERKKIVNDLLGIVEHKGEKSSTFKTG